MPFLQAVHACFSAFRRLSALVLQSFGTTIPPLRRSFLTSHKARPNLRSNLADLNVPPLLGKHGRCAAIVSTLLLTVPVELGMLTLLKELYLCDNHLQTLPPELGTLHQLQMPRVIIAPADRPTNVGTAGNIKHTAAEHRYGGQRTRSPGRTSIINSASETRSEPAGMRTPFSTPENPLSRGRASTSPRKTTCPRHGVPSCDRVNVLGGWQEHGGGGRRESPRVWNTPETFAAHSSSNGVDFECGQDRVFHRRRTTSHLRPRYRSAVV
ncbi:hypothetical protein V8D89_015553 [Ganoderma adspersum]